MAASKGTREEKVKRIFNEFDKNKDGGLNRDEMSSLVVSVNPRVQFSNDQINAILEEVFRSYEDFINGDKGLTFAGLLQTYDDGAGDVDRDFEALELELEPITDSIATIADISIVSQASTSTSAVEPIKNPRSPAWAASPNHEIVFEDSRKIVDDLEILIKRLKAKQAKHGRLKGDNVVDACSEPGWSSELCKTSDFVHKKVFWDELGKDYTSFVKELGVLRGRLDENRSNEEVFDGHMAIGRVLYEHHLFKEALVSFKCACDLQPMNFRPHFRAGNCLYVLGRYGEGKEEFLLALEAAKTDGNQWSYLLPQIHVNLGISLEGEGMVLSACEHYREATILCPTHFRALKLLGSALFGVGEYRAAEKSLEEAIFLKSDYADAHCDLGSTLHALGEDDRAIQEFQKAIDLKPGHVDALYNLGGLYMDMGRYQRASEMYTRVLALWPNHWRAVLNKAVALLGVEDSEEANKNLKEAFKMTNRVELHDAMSHLKQLQKKRSKGNGDGEAGFLVVELSKFNRVGSETTRREDLSNALEIRSFQRLTRLNHCNVDLLKKEIDETNIPISYSDSGIPEKSINKAGLERILRKLLHFLKPETFQEAVKAINKRIITILDSWGSGKVDLGMFYAVLAPICTGPSKKRKQIVFNALMWRPVNEVGVHIRKVDAMRYIKLLRAIYIPSHVVSEISEVNEETDASTVSFPEFLEMFDNQDWGFGIMDTLVKLENGDRTRHGHHPCSVCRYPIIGSRFKEMKSHFSLCCQCYSEGRVPSTFKRGEYKFKEYGNETEAIKDKCTLLSLHPRSSSQSEHRL